MLAQFDGQDYYVQLIPLELTLLERGGGLEAELTDQSRKPINKKLTLQRRETTHSDGIEVNYLPPKADDFEAVKEVQVLTASRALERLRAYKSASARCNSSDIIAITLE